MASGIPDSLNAKSDGKARPSFDTSSPPEDIFQLTALETVLKAKLEHSETKKDSLMGILTELHMRNTDNEELFEKGTGFGAEPREKAWNKNREKDPDLEKTKALVVGQIDSLKIEIQSIKRRMEANNTLIQLQLKGGKP